jgi:hypothetical protein
MEFQLVGTVEVQMESLRMFMQQLGYVPYRENGGWITANPALQANRVMSTRTAIKLHNLTKKGWKEFKPGWYHPAGIPVDIAVNSYSLNILLTHKIVQQVKLQAKRSATNGFVFPPDANANLIKFTDKRYHKLFNLPTQK